MDSCALAVVLPYNKVPTAGRLVSVALTTGQSHIGFKGLWQKSVRWRWAITCDSLFFFHPDKGYWGNGGQFIFESTRTKLKAQQVEAGTKDSTASSINLQRVAEKRSWWTLFRYYFLAGIATLCLVGWQSWRRLRKTVDKIH